MTLTYIDTVILGICLLEGGMDRGCVNNGICIIRTLQRVCLSVKRLARNLFQVEAIPGLPFIIS